jgi:hypothetical protein
MTVFDGPDGLQGVEQRSTTTVAPQALLLLNNPDVRTLAEAFARRIAADNRSLSESVTIGYRSALGRDPRDSEPLQSDQFIKDQMAAYRSDGKADARHLALADFCQVLMGLNEFIYVD